MAFTFRDFLVGVANSAPAMAESLYRYQERMIQERQLANQERQTTALIDYYGAGAERERMETDRIGQLLPIEVDTARIKKDYEASMLRTQTFREGNQKEAFDNEQADIKQRTATLKVQCDIAIEQLSQLEDRAPFERLNNELTYYQNLLTVSEMINKFTPEDRKQIEVYLKNAKSLPDGSIDVSSIAPLILGAKLSPPMNDWAAVSVAQANALSLAKGEATMTYRANLMDAIAIGNRKPFTEWKARNKNVEELAAQYIKEYGRVPTQVDLMIEEYKRSYDIDMLTFTPSGILRQIIDTSNVNYDEQPTGGGGGMTVDELLAPTSMYSPVPETPGYLERGGTGVPGAVYDVGKKVPSVLTAAERKFREYGSLVFPQLTALEELLKGELEKSK